MSTEEEKRYKREYMRAYNQTEKGRAYNRAHSKAWRRIPGNRKQSSHKQSSKSYRDIIIDHLIKRDGLVCGICNKSLENTPLHINHIIPVALGGPCTMDNVNLTHSTCNIQEGLKVRIQVQGY